MACQSTIAAALLQYTGKSNKSRLFIIAAPALTTITTSAIASLTATKYYFYYCYCCYYCCCCYYYCCYYYCYYYYQCSKLTPVRRSVAGNVDKGPTMLNISRFRGPIRFPLLRQYRSLRDLELFKRTCTILTLR